jgi:hypothetical protein
MTDVGLKTNNQRQTNSYISQFIFIVKKKILVTNADRLIDVKDFTNLQFPVGNYAAFIVLISCCATIMKTR